MRISIVVPCFNEGEGVSHLVSKLDVAIQKLKQDFEVDVIFVDDGSHDGTAELLERAFSANGPFSVKVIRHPANQGVGAAQRSGFHATTADFVVTMDSDCTYDPIEIVDMISLMTDEVDLVVASPYHPRGRVSNVPRYRLFLSRNLSKIYNWILGQGLHTYTSLFRVYRREVIKEVPFQANGFLSMAEILVNAIRLGFIVREFPAQLRLRQYGTSKIKIAGAIVEHLKFISELFRKKLNGQLKSQAQKTQSIGIGQPIKIQLPSDGEASGRSFGKEELALLEQVIRSGTLHATRGTMVRQLEQEFAKKYGVRHCVAVSSGTASLHTAIAAIDPDPGDEIITTPITDMGGVSAILFQNAIPIFADVDPETYNLTAEALNSKITSRTKGIVVVHLFGNPCDMDPIVELANRHGIPLIEDCAQAFLTPYKGRWVGTLGAIGCFSLQQTKQMTAGEGGLIITNDDTLARRMRLFRDKAWGYGDPNPDHYFLAPNYRMTDLQGAVALAQLRKLEGMIEKRKRTAQKLTEIISDLKGVHPPKVTPGGMHTYWRYCLQVDEELLGVDVAEFAKRLKEYGIISTPRYIQKPAFQCAVLRERKTYGASQFPYRGSHRTGLPEVIYDEKDFPGTFKALSRILVLPWNEAYTEEQVRYIARCLIDTVNECLNQNGKG